MVTGRNGYISLKTVRSGIDCRVQSFIAWVETDFPVSFCKIYSVITFVLCDTGRGGGEDEDCLFI